MTERRNSERGRGIGIPAARRAWAFVLSGRPRRGRRRSRPDEEVEVAPAQVATERWVELWEELQSTGRFSRDTRSGAMLHGGELSLREISDRDSLHVTVGENNRISVHIDKVSPLARKHRGWVARYSAPRVVAHVVFDVVGTFVQLVTRRRERHRMHLECGRVEAEVVDEAEVRTEKTGGPNRQEIVKPGEPGSIKATRKSACD